mgnify:CR=1 FL=1
MPPLSSLQIALEKSRKEASGLRAQNAALLALYDELWDVKLPAEALNMLQPWFAKVDAAIAAEKGE